MNKSNAPLIQVPLIQVTHLTKSFNGSPVLKDITCSVFQGEVVSVIGPSGMGKSTFLRCLNGLEKPDQGEILLEGQIIQSNGANMSTIRQKMGMVFQSFNLFPHLLVIQNVMAAPMKLRGESWDEAYENAMRLLSLVGLADKADALPDELSGGQKQRVAIARALAMRPEILLFDEPTSALDPTMVDEVLAVIKSLAQGGMTMMIVTHEMQFAHDVSSRVFYMDEGVIYEQGPVAQVFDQPIREKTRLFVKRVKAWSFSIQSPDFDRWRMFALLETFCQKQFFTAKQTFDLKMLTEEMLFSVLLKKTSRIDFEVQVSDGAGTTVTFTFDGPQENPLAEIASASGYTDSSGESLFSSLPLVIINSLISNMDYEIAEGRNQLRLELRKSGQTG